MWGRWLHVGRTQVDISNELLHHFHFRDRQFCYCGNVEPPVGFSVGLEMCGEECPPSEWTDTYSADPWAMTMYEPCGKTHYTMVRMHIIIQEDTRIVSDLLHFIHKLCLLGLHHLWWARIGPALHFPFHRDWRVNNATPSCDLPFILKMGHMGSRVISGERSSMGREYDPCPLRRRVCSSFLLLLYSVSVFQYLH